MTDFVTDRQTDRQTDGQTDELKVFWAFSSILKNKKLSSGFSNFKIFQSATNQIFNTFHNLRSGVGPGRPFIYLALLFHSPSSPKSFSALDYSWF